MRTQESRAACYYCFHDIPLPKISSKYFISFRVKYPEVFVLRSKDIFKTIDKNADERRHFDEIKSHLNG